MKRAVLSLMPLGILLGAFPPESSAQMSSVTTLRVGYFNPKDAKAGFMFGANWGFPVDEAVDIGVGVDYFHKRYTKKTAVADRDYQSGVHETTVQRELEYSTNILPLTGTIHVQLPAGYWTKYLLAGSLGYAFLFNKEKNYVDGTSASRTYRGFHWQLSAGMLLRTGRRSGVTGEVFYNNSTVSRNKTSSPKGLPIWDEVDLSGLGVRFGVRLGLR